VQYSPNRTIQTRDTSQLIYTAIRTRSIDETHTALCPHTRANNTTRNTVTSTYRGIACWEDAPLETCCLAFALDPLLLSPPLLVDAAAVLVWSLDVEAVKSRVTFALFTAPAVLSDFN